MDLDLFIKVVGLKHAYIGTYDFTMKAGNLLETSQSQFFGQ